MLFNSYEFVFAFMPATVVLYFAFGRISRSLALAWLIVASVAFYAWWRPFNLLIIGPSLVLNFLIARLLVQLAARRAAATAARMLLVLGIVFNLALLGYFKYANFVAGAANDVFGTGFVLEQIILPLGISFIAFQKIAFLIDVHAGRIERFTFREFCLFILFFPQLIAGPIVHFRETMPQFRSGDGRFDADDFALGLTLFVMGLFKKVVLADGIAAHVVPVYQAAAAGEPITLIPAWIAAVGFTLQIYFDFSGYSDMAIGLARMFGIRLPVNFDSPLKATNIIDFWLRWHITLTRFLTAYVYNPLALALTRRRLGRGKPGLTARNASFGAFAVLLAGPTIFTMFLSGLWHGAGYLFIVWGLLHGVYLATNHAWRIFVAHRWARSATYARVAGPLGLILTFVSVAVAMVLFRAPSVAAAGEILQGMLGGNGIALPQVLVAALTGVPQLTGAFAVHPGSATAFAMALAWTAALLALAMLAPNTLELAARREPAIGFRADRLDAYRWFAKLAWRPSLPWMFFIGTLGIVAIMRLSGPSEFLYWQF